MSHFRSKSVIESSRRRLLAGALATTTLISAAPASAFFQQTKLEGTIGSNIGGVWLSVQQIMPEFRVTYPKPATGPAVPVTVGPLPADLEPITGRNAPGVVITACENAAFCTENGLLVGDMVIQINTSPIADVAGFQKALENPAAMIMLSIRRTALKMTTTRLIKFKYEAEEKKEEAGTSVGQELLDLQVLDVVLPFAEEVEKTRTSHSFFQPSAKQLEELKARWPELPLTDPQRLASAKHRFVAKAAFDEPLENDVSLKNSSHALIMDMQGAPVRGGGGKVIDVYGFESMAEKEMSGSYVSVTIANAPFPINIEFKGRFRMIRVDDWSDKDVKLRQERDGSARPAEDPSKFKTLPDTEPSRP